MNKSISKKVLSLVLVILIVTYAIINLIGGMNLWAATVPNQVRTEDMNELTFSAYPKIKDLIEDLQEKHPNWKFEILYTDLDWNTVIKNETTVKHRRSLVPEKDVYGRVLGGNEWLCDTCSHTSSWRCASIEAVEFFMDVRNWINEEQIFQFLLLTEYVCNEDTFEDVVKNTFLENSAAAIIKAAEDNNLNPYFLFARMIQENGNKGKEQTKGIIDDDGNTYYNVFNMDVTESSDQVIINKQAVAEAKEANPPWTSLEQAIIGGTQKLVERKIAIGQDTLYLQKFDVDYKNKELYWQQYMQNLFAPTSECINLKGKMVSAQVPLDDLTFVIPVYKNMPRTTSPKPAAETAKTWDISKTANDSVEASLDDNGILTISGTGKMKDWSSTETIFQDTDERKNPWISLKNPWYSFVDEIKQIKIENGVTNIGNYAFEDCTNLTQIEISDTVTHIGENAFYGCTSLRNIQIPKDITEIEAKAFRRCSSLEKIEVDDENNYFSSENGILFNKDKTKLIQYPNSKLQPDYTYEISLDVTSIGDYAFENCTYLKNVIIPKGVKNIGKKVFNNCSSGLKVYSTTGSEAQKYASENNISFVVDDEAPTTTITGNPTEWTKQDVTITIAAEDSIVGVHETPYKFSIDDQAGEWQKSKTYTVGQNCNIEIEVRDLLGNVTTQTIIVNKIDKEKPIISSVEGNPTEWTKEDVTIIVDAKDEGSDLNAEGAYKFNVDGREGEWQESNTYTVSENCTIEVEVRDALEKIQSQTIIISKIDKEAPEFKILGNPTEWTKDDVRIEVTAKDIKSGLHADGAYKFNVNGQEGEWQKSNTYTVSKNCAIEVEVRDALEKIQSQTIIISKIDKGFPEIIISGNPRVWTKEDVTIEVTATNIKSGLHTEGAYKFKINGQEGEWQESNTYTVSENCTIEVEVRDALEKIQSQTITISKIDKVDPTISFVNGITTKWTNKDVIITVEGTDDDNDIMTIDSGVAEYSFDGGKSWQKSNEKKYIENTKDIIIQVKDNAGNTFEYQNVIEIGNIDKIVPTIRTVVPNVDRWTNRDVVLKVEATDNDENQSTVDSGISGYSFDGGKTWQVSNEKKYVENTSQIQIKVKDNAGNITEYQNTIDIDNIDKIEPTITINSDEVQYVTINIDENGGSGLSQDNEYKYQLSTSQEEPKGEWHDYAVGEKFVIGKGLKGEYYLWVKSVKDNAGNETRNIVSEKFVFNEEKTEITSTKYTIGEDKIITKIAPGTTVAQFMENIDSNYKSKIKVYNNKGQEISGQELVGTGSKIEVNGEKYTLGVSGDTEGDGKVDANDAIKVLAHIAGVQKLEGEYLIVVQLNKEGKLTINDIIKLLRYIANPQDTEL